jgi:tetratricopeptide (TPR) repeat protein
MLLKTLSDKFKILNKFVNRNKGVFYNLLFIFLCFIIGFSLYFKSFKYDYIWDDYFGIKINPFIGSLKNIIFYFKGLGINLTYYRPLSGTYFNLIYNLIDKTPFSFHIIQTSIHILNSLLIFLILNLMLKKRALSAFLALIFLVHPINIEGVIWISAAAGPLFMLFGLIAVYYLIANKELKISDYYLIDIFLFLSLLSLETGIVFFLLIFAYLILFRKKGLIKYMFFTVILLPIYFFFRFVTKSLYTNTPVIKDLIPIMHASLLERIYTMPKIVLFYLTTFLYPKDLSISQHWVVKTINFNDFIFPLIIVLIFFILCLIYIVKTNNKTFLFFFIWFCLGIGIHSQIIPLSMTVAERWFYFPIIGLLGMIEVLIKNIKYKKSLVIVGVIIFSSLYLRSYYRILNWKNTITLFQHDQKINKTSYDLENNLGTALIRAGKLKEGEKHVRNSIKVAPNLLENRNNLGIIYELKEDYKNAEKSYKIALKKNPLAKLYLYTTYKRLVIVLIKQQKFEEAHNYLNKALLIYPSDDFFKSIKPYVKERLNEL